MVGLVVTSEQARKLVADLTANPDPQVASVALADVLSPMIGQSTTYIGMPNAWNVGYEATGQVVVVLDTGVSSSHPFLAGDVFYEGCFGTTDGVQWAGDCLNENFFSNSPLPTPGSGAPCTSSPDCAHGTHVAGIATGRNGTTRGVAAHGVARRAQVAAIQIFSRNTQTVNIGAIDQDVFEALYALVNTVQADVFTLNFSIAKTGVRVLSTCVDTLGTAWATDNLRDRRIPTVAAVGNEGMFGFTWPACIGSIVKVMSMCSINDPAGGFHGNCTPVQMSTTFTNYANPAVFGGPTFIAPGNNIYSSVPGGGFELKHDTSMASPHVAGLYAAVKAASPGATVADVTAWIQTNAVNMTHPQMPGVTYKRIRVP